MTHVSVPGSIASVLPTPTILVVDDTLVSRSATCALLGRLDVNVVSCRDGAECLAAVIDRDVALILLDVEMPDINGFEVAQKLRKMPEASDVPIIFITAHRLEAEHAVHGYETGGVDYLSAPFDPYILLSKAKVFIDLYLSRKKLELEIGQREREEKLRQTIEVKLLAQSKLATLGEVAAGMAHEFNQPLMMISGIAQRMLRFLDNGDLEVDKARSMLDQSLRHVARITTLVEHLKAFGRVSPPGERVAVDIVELIGRAFVFFGGRIESGDVTLEINGDREQYYVDGDASALEQVFVNMVQNSVAALRDSDDKRITVDVLPIATEPSNARIRVRFCDTGSGMNARTAERVFEPFFTTRDAGQGTGLGLSIAYGIITDHGGEIDCQSALGKGTIFSMDLPAATLKE